ncbi:MAG: HNH endonuclease signature motif containing protein, partial [Nitrospirota bacterium]|nr:HNH endonuclease signature motif containing protein [Nitrospirota bacterium]
MRYLEADRVTLPSRAPLFVEPGRCQWCSKPLTGRAKFYCRPSPDSPYSNASECAVLFLNWWSSRPAYVRAAFIRDSFTCQNCGIRPMQQERPWLPDLSRLECDHRIPLSKGGETVMDNLQTLCDECHKRKGLKKTVPPK